MSGYLLLALTINMLRKASNCYFDYPCPLSYKQNSQPSSMSPNNSRVLIYQNSSISPPITQGDLENTCRLFCYIPWINGDGHPVIHYALTRKTNRLGWTIPGSPITRPVQQPPPGQPPTPPPPTGQPQNASQAPDRPPILIL